MPAFHENEPATDAIVADLLSELDLHPGNDNGSLGEGAAEDSTISALGGAQPKYTRVGLKKLELLTRRTVSHADALAPSLRVLRGFSIEETR
jgi:hypothetical protein